MSPNGKNMIAFNDAFGMRLEVRRGRGKAKDAIRKETNNKNLNRISIVLKHSIKIVYYSYPALKIDVSSKCYVFRISCIVKAVCIQQKNSEKFPTES